MAMTNATAENPGFTAYPVVPLEDPACRAVQLSLVDRLTAPKYRPPILPVIAVQLMDLSRRPSVKIREIAGLLEQDPILAADMLKVTHSAILALSAPIRTVEEALVRLGMRRSTELFVHAALKAKLFRCRGYEVVLEQLRRHCVATAEVARMVAQSANVDEDYTYLAGLLHDVGIAGCILALGARGSHLPPPPFEKAWPAIRSLHQRFALHLCIKWNLPKEIRHNLTQHFAFLNCQGPDTSAAVTVLAEQLTYRLGLGFEDQNSDALRAKAQSVLGLEDAQLDRITVDAAWLTERIE